MQGGNSSHSPSCCQVDSQGVAIPDVWRLRLDALCYVKFCNCAKPGIHRISHLPSGLISNTKGSAQILHEQHKVQFEAWAAFKPELAVERCGFLIYGVHQHGPAADDFRTSVSA